jgi:membrane fusion protein (multidrug efflux system)
LIRVKIDNKDAELIPGSLLEVTVNYNERNSLGIPDTSIMLEGDKIYVYKVSENNITNKVEVKIGIRDGGYVEVLSGLILGENIVAEGLKKVRPKSKIKPIKR